MKRIVASIPGRIRVRDPGLRIAERLARLQEVFLCHDAVLAVESNPLAGSLVLRYDATRIDPELLEQAVEDTVDAELECPVCDAPASRRERLNRLAKIGMLASLGTSLALAAAGQKRWHALTGLVFLAGLGVHLTLHRQRILR